MFFFQIGPCSALIYIGEHRTGTKNGELNIIVEQFKKNDRAIFVSRKKWEKKTQRTSKLNFVRFVQVDCRMEVDEIYEDLKTDLLNFMWTVNRLCFCWKFFSIYSAVPFVSLWCYLFFNILFFLLLHLLESSLVVRIRVSAMCNT